MKKTSINRIFFAAIFEYRRVYPTCSFSCKRIHNQSYSGPISQLMDVIYCIYIYIYITTGTYLFFLLKSPQGIFSGTKKSKDM